MADVLVLGDEEGFERGDVGADGVGALFVRGGVGPACGVDGGEGERGEGGGDVGAANFGVDEGCVGLQPGGGGEGRGEEVVEEGECVDFGGGEGRKWYLCAGG